MSFQFTSLSSPKKLSCLSDPKFLTKEKEVIIFLKPSLDAVKKARAIQKAKIPVQWGIRIRTQLNTHQSCFNTI